MKMKESTNKGNFDNNKYYIGVAIVVIITFFLSIFGVPLYVLVILALIFGYFWKKACENKK